MGSETALYPRCVAYLEVLGAGSIPHPGGNLLAHLIRTARLLKNWGAAPILVKAGLGHAVYGTDGFAVTLVGLERRCEVAARFGDEAESAIYLYASCDRTLTYRSLLTDQAVRFRDRFSGLCWALHADESDLLVRLILANELDLIDYQGGTATVRAFVESLVGRYGPQLPRTTVEHARHALAVAATSRHGPASTGTGGAGKAL